MLYIILVLALAVAIVVIIKLSKGTTISKKVRLNPFPKEWIDNYVSESGGFVNWSDYILHGTNIKTDKRRRFTAARVKTRIDAINEATNHGFTKPFEISVMPTALTGDNYSIVYSDDVPDDEIGALYRAVDKARKLGIVLPKNACFYDVYAMIDRVKNDDMLSPDEFTVRKASQINWQFSRYVGRDELRYRVHEWLKYNAPDDPDIGYFVDSDFEEWEKSHGINPDDGSDEDDE